MKIRFKNPPINELIIGAYFNPSLRALRSEHIGLLWSRLRDEFPTVRQREPIGGAAETHSAVEANGGEFLVMPRFWFISENGANLIQVQKNAFLLNWRRREAEYPHFAEHLKPSFDRYYGVFDEFLRQDAGVKDIRIGVCELTYVNVVEPCGYWQGPQDTHRVIPSFTVPDNGLVNDSASLFNCAYRFGLAPQSQLHVAVRTAEASGNPGSPRLILELKALGRVGSVSMSDTQAWYEEAHDAVVTCFLSMTNRDVQDKYWIREGGSE